MNRPLHLEIGDPAAFMPRLGTDDALGAHWLAHATWRLRREVAWLWHERALQGLAVPEAAAAALPPTIDHAWASLDLARHVHAREAFFAADSAARHLDERLRRAAPAPDPAATRGSFGWLAARLRLSPLDCFVLALALLPSVDGSAASVIACCQNDALKTAPTLALAQRLWDAPDDLLACFDPAHPLWRHGLLDASVGSDWQAALRVPTLVARELLFAGGPLPYALLPVGAGAPREIEAATLARLTLAAGHGVAGGRRVVAVTGPAGAPLAEWAAACADAGPGLSTVRVAPALAREHWAQACAAAWLRGHALYLDAATLVETTGHEPTLVLPPLPGLPLLVFVGAHDKALLRGLDAAGDGLPPLQVAPLTYGQRVAHWHAALPQIDSHSPWLPQLARRFRYEPAAIARVGAELRALRRPPDLEDVLAAASADLDLGSLAQPVVPRFTLAELVLPPTQAAQIADIVRATENLTRVHHDWGTARAWNEGGLAVLFSGPPGTGKTMAAEAVAQALALPMWRIDLSQVVNKYIGETEKNLRRVFDAADSADVILFFDEADALFGKRTEVRDAHDRYANLEISYLLERMERFKGLAILATNRRRDLDEAFARRLRFAVEFPVPCAAERLRLWRGAVPGGVDTRDVDFDFLAQRFTLAGGHIRAVVFQACLLSAGPEAPKRLQMPAVMRALKREYDKLDRAVSLEQFGPYAAHVSGAEGAP
jgi:hypothetical protein